MIVELHGLEVFGRHGAYEEEQRDGQVFLFDVELDVGDRGADDRLEGAVDYTEVAAAIREISDAQRFDLLEALATATVDGLHERFRPERVRVRVRKQPAGLPVEYSAVTAERP
ncbi:MAG TPA: dihydroneopterin aldolase [Gaiellaceae bacterium]|jgi:dihydroneopterin aldolase|nr:dihydroneopterin aldolase [Gaiellaceae bacterium]